LAKISAACQHDSPQRASGGFEFEKRSQLFTRTHNVTLSLAAMRVSNPDCSPFVLESELANLQCFQANFPLWGQK